MWIEVKDYPYEVSEYDDVRRLESDVILKPSICGRGYKQVMLFKEGISHTKAGHYYEQSTRNRYK